MTDDCPMTGEEIIAALLDDGFALGLASANGVPREFLVTATAAYAKGRIAGMEEAAKVADEGYSARRIRALIAKEQEPKA